MADRNFLIGYGERLAEPINPVSGGGTKHFPYTFSEARTRLAPRFTTATTAVRDLPDLACPFDFSTLALTLHPAFLAKSYYPENFLEYMDMFALGAKAEKITPEVVLGKTDKRESRDAPTIFAAVKRKTLRSFSKNLKNWQPSSNNISNDFRKIEDVRAPKTERLKIQEIDLERNYPLEVVLHIGIPGISNEIYEAFEAFSAKLNAEVLSDHVRTVGELTFVPVRCPGESLRSLCEFSLIRSIRVMPKVRMGQTALRSVKAPPFQPVFPIGPVLDPTIKTAVFDGGLPNNPHPLTQWAQEYSTPNLGSPDQSAQEHGTAVTCAALFGSLQKGTTPPQPFSSIRHYRVIDHNPVHDFDLVDILHRITKTLDHESFDFLNISMGPDMPIDDDDINVWTATLDKYAFQQQCFVSIACGNSGEEDHAAGNTRIQPASDGVNVVGIGASDKASGEWGRASYSSVGPGRSPGVVKPDVVSHGGSNLEPFYTLDFWNLSLARPIEGTSFAAPSVMRRAVGVRATFGDYLNAPAIKALIINKSDSRGNKQKEVGWGKPTELEQLCTCQDNEVTVLYKGYLDPRRWMRFPIPEPSGGFVSMTRVRATFCLFPDIDPDDAINYTRAGVNIVFRPNTRGHPGYQNGKARQLHKSKTFFSPSQDFPDEASLRSGGHKWEPVLSAERRFQPSTLDRPVFDVEHQSRWRGKPAARRSDIPYGMVITVICEKDHELYNKIVRAYSGTLEVLQPQIEIPAYT